MDYKEVPVGGRIYLQPEDPSYKPVLSPSDIQSVSVRDCPMGYCIKMEFGNVTSICKYMVRYGGIEENKSVVESVRCKYGKNPADRKVMLLGVFTCPIDRIGCIWLGQDGKKRCEYLGGILEPVSTARLHYSVVCNHPGDSIGDI